MTVLMQEQPIEIIRYLGRDVVVFNGHPFYRSSSSNHPDMAGRWFPFLGYHGSHWFIKPEGHPHIRDQKLRADAQRLEDMHLPAGAVVMDGVDVNKFLKRHGFVNERMYFGEKN